MLTPRETKVYLFIYVILELSLFYSLVEIFAVMSEINMKFSNNFGSQSHLNWVESKADAQERRIYYYME